MCYNIIYNLKRKGVFNMNEKSKKYLEETIKRRKESLESVRKAHS